MWDSIYVCECGGEAVALYDWSHDDWAGLSQISLSLWRYGAGTGFGWKWKLRHIWYIVRYGHPYVDDVILSAQNALRLGYKLVEFAQGAVEDGEVATAQRAVEDEWTQ